jgi:hypothetical protein
MPSASLRLLTVFAAFAWAAGAAAQPAPGWEEARKAILADYAKQLPGDKVLEVTGPERKEGNLLAVRYFGTVLLERADKTRERQRVAVDYVLVGSRWEQGTVRMYESIALPDVNPPSKDEAQRVIAAAWQKANCEGFDIKSIALEGEPRFQRETTADRANAKRWFVYQIQIDAVGTGKFRLSEDGAPYVNRTQNMLLWDPAARSWSVDPRHVRCGGFSKKS